MMMPAGVTSAPTPRITRRGGEHEEQGRENRDLCNASDHAPVTSVPVTLRRPTLGVNFGEDGRRCGSSA